MTVIALSEAHTPGALFSCHTCGKAAKVPDAHWANNFICIHCSQEYQRVLPEASQEDLNHLFGIQPSPYKDFGSF